MKVSDFPYYHPPFPAYNKAQVAVIPYLDKDVNVVVSFPTAAGKTVVAECAFAYLLKTDPNCSVAYVCPSRALADERVKDWYGNSQLSQYGIAQETSDSDNRMTNDYSKRLIVATIEAFDAKTRSAAWQSWIKRLKCVTFDESHLLGDKSRGGALEAAIMRFTALNSDSKLILLSATMSNTLELAKWIKSLNGKATKAIVSNWRPTKIITQHHLVADSRERDAKAVELALRDKDSKTIVFVHSKRVGLDIAKRIKSTGIRVAFHCASVPRIRRVKMEKAFDSRASGLNILVSTSTLAAGINLAK
jgi:replicative superfamily II helicase